MDPERIADDILEAEKSPSLDAESLASSILEGHQLSASQLLEADFEPGSYASKSMRWSLARGDTLKEKKLRLRKKYPTGEIQVLPESIVMGFEEDTLVFRESPQARWKMVEPQGFDRFDVFEAIAPSAESIAVETGIAIGSGGSSVPVTIGRQALGAVIGEGIEQVGQYASGVQDQSFSAASGEALKEGGYSAAGGLIISPVVALKNAVTGAGALKVGEEGIETIGAANALDPDIVKKLTPALVTDNPAIRLSEAQSAALLPALNRRYRDLISKLDVAVKSSSPGNSSNAMTQVSQSLQDLGDYFLKRVSTNGTPMSKGGAALRQGVEQYSEASRKVVGDLYEQARKIQEPEFDMAPVRTLISDLRRGSKGALDPAVDTQLKAFEAINGPIQLSDGVLSVTDQIRNVRTELYSLKNIEPGKVANQSTGQANDVYQALTQVLQNPTNRNVAFERAWKAANDAASDRFAKLEQAPIIAAAKSQNPSDLVKSYVRPYQSDNLLAIRGTVSSDQWSKFVDAAYTDLAIDPANISKKLAAFDQETLDVLMPRAEQALWRTVGKEIDRITAIGPERIAEIQVTNRNFVDEIIESANPQKVRSLMRAANNTNNREMRESLRAAIVEWTWDGIVSKGKNKLSVNEATLKSRIAKLKDTEMWRFLSPKERSIIGNASIVSRAFQGVADAGTSIQANEAVSGIKSFKSTAIMTFLRSEMLAQFYMSDIGRRMLIGSGMPHSNGAMLRLLSGSLAQTLPPEDLSKYKEEE